MLVKERLTGALILVGVIVVLVPELLSGPIRPAARSHGPAPSAEEPPLRSYTINLADDTHGVGGAAQPQPAGPAAPMAAAEPAAAPAAGAASPPATPAPAAAPAQHAPPMTPPPAAAAAQVAPAASARPVVRPSTATPVAAPSASGAAVAYVVQLGSFANRANAERLAQQVRALGYPVGVSRGTTGRRLYRVQVGPTRDRAAAEQLAAKLRIQGQRGAVVPK